MCTSEKRLGLAALAGLLTLAVAAPSVRAQRVPVFHTQANPNVALSAQTHQLGLMQQYYQNLLAPVPAQMGIYPYLSPLAFTPTLISNPFNPYLVNPYLAAPVLPVNPYALQAAQLQSALAAQASLNPLAMGFANPYAATPGGAATLTSTGVLPTNLGFGGATMTSTTPYASPYGYSPYGGYGYSYTDPYAGYLNGSAKVIDSQGRFLNDVQSSLMKRQEVFQKMLESRQLAMKEFKWEQENRLTPEDQREWENQQAVRRALNEPPINDVLSAIAPNTLLANLAKQPPDKIQNGPSIPLEENLLQHVNVTKGGGANPGLLKNGGNLHWPQALQGEAYTAGRDKFDELFKAAVGQARTGPVNSGTLTELSRLLDQMNAQLSNNQKDLPPNEGIAARHFLANLGSAVRALQDPQVKNYLNGTWAPKGATVADLVRYLVDRGLSFAPAVSS
ncbi:MAG: hypothetical protein JO112_08285, partial [Planctomycetes bacterium]|nr:hypothetical protein [Planctomycetota bacterium]